jgi:hypothetical protein
MTLQIADVRIIKIDVLIQFYYFLETNIVVNINLVNNHYFWNYKHIEM